MPSKLARKPANNSGSNDLQYDDFVDRLVNALEYLSREAKAANLTSISEVITDAAQKSLDIYVTQKWAELEQALQGQSSELKSKMN
ncbi:hypothetical protein [Asticcacaulis machinosus]|uniref:Uncharacterized protein n=1 Tax=Asticcacaulis machinosus TaxID=2984211 RepID=A0ABT5HHX4_9CAUL|nr:hypothetical protein [Asticcacaulis machinosus]MDC7675204.1 hypothetical protein [Asticcacaulis machinosus]